LLQDIQSEPSLPADMQNEAFCWWTLWFLINLLLDTSSNKIFIYGFWERERRWNVLSAPAPFFYRGIGGGTPRTAAHWQRPLRRARSQRGSGRGPGAPPQPPERSSRLSTAHGGPHTATVSVASQAHCRSPFPSTRAVSPWPWPEEETKVEERDKGRNDISLPFSLLKSQKWIFYWVECPVVNLSRTRVSTSKTLHFACPLARGHFGCPVANFALIFPSKYTTQKMHQTTVGTSCQANIFVLYLHIELMSILTWGMWVSYSSVEKDVPLQDFATPQNQSSHLSLYLLLQMSAKVV
jgi:hypothetical protein